ncbi:class I SAM-dependent methyltransferase [Legionella dresdenensis]|uniref:Class I SAM-dependent methyltransferase n=1 Tax=Legionella dresdenensis TaxID=450200 RepID=A0ABV8CC95_9GAMM
MKQLLMTQELHDYMLDVSLREHPVLAALREETGKMALANMQAAPEQAQFMQFLIRLIRARKVLEIGTFTGYSSLAMALALPDDGELITCDINRDWTANAPSFWREAGQDHKIKLKLAPALDTINDLLAQGYSQQFDFIFIDADKTNYVNYYEMALKLINPSGLIAIDNIFWDGKVIDNNETGGQTREIRRLNQLLKQDDRVDVSLLAIADGLFLVRPKS